MSSSSDLTRDWLRNVLRPYTAKDRLLSEVMDILNSRRTLSVKTDAFTFDSGQTSLLLLLHGTLPINYKGSTYQIPIHIWITHDYPRNPPLAFVVPTKEMGVRKGREVEPGGRVREEVVEGWWRGWESKSIEMLLRQLTTIFSMTPPVYAKPPESSQAQPVAGSSRMGSMSPQNTGQGRNAAGPSSQPPPPPLRPYQSPAQHSHTPEFLPQYQTAPTPPPNPFPPQTHSRQSSASYPYRPPETSNTIPPLPNRPYSQTQSQGYAPPTPPRQGSLPPTSPVSTGVSGMNGIPQLPNRPYIPNHPSNAGVSDQGRSVSTGPYDQRYTSPPPAMPPTHYPTGQYSHPQNQPSIQYTHPSQNGQPSQTPIPTPGQTMYTTHDSQAQIHPPYQPIPHSQQPQPYQAHPNQFPQQPYQPQQQHQPSILTSPDRQQPATRHIPAPDLLSSENAEPFPSSPSQSHSNQNSSAPPPLPSSKPPPPSLLHLHSILLPHLNASLPPLLHSLAAERSNLEDRKEDLKSGEPAIKDEMARLEAVLKVCMATGKKLEDVVSKGRERVDDLDGRGEVGVDEVVCGISIVHNQLIDLVAEDNALDDTIYHMTRALDTERIDLTQYIKSIRTLAREQYMKRALIERILQSMGQNVTW